MKDTDQTPRGHAGPDSPPPSRDGTVSDHSADHLRPLDDIHLRVKWLFVLLTFLSVIILATMAVRLITKSEPIQSVDLGWMCLFAVATISLTLAEITCLRYIRTQVRPHMVSLVLRDEVTGLFNRRYMNDRIDEEISRSRRHDRRFAVIYVDLDGFKSVNDRHGHEAGDHVLREAARFLADNIRREDIIARIGGDEFLALLPDTKSSDAANLVIRLHTGFAAQPFATPTGEPVDALSFSAGVASFPDDADTRPALQAVADKNMYAHKLAK